MKTLGLFLFLTIATSTLLYSQVKMTLFGNPNDSTIIKKKQRLEAKGFTVVIQQAEDKNPLLTMGDQAFRKKHIGTILPAFKLKDINGNTVSSEDLKGKFVHINFWSTTCVPCIKEFPELVKLKQKYEEKDWAFIALAPESEKLVNSVLAKHPLDYIIIPEAKAYYELLDIGGYPKNFFIDKSGKIIEVTDGTKFVQNPVTKELVPDNFRFYDMIMAEIK